MYDIHSHMLHNVDDGPTSLEESKKMIDMAYKDGIRSMISTVHYNHPLDFSPTKTVEASFKELSKYIKDKYPDFKLYLGKEVYINSNFDFSTENLPSLTLNSSRYMLVEFSRLIRIDEIKGYLHELLIRKITPIIAHVEIYDCFVKDIQSYRELVSEGVLFQVTGSSIFGKHGEDISKFVCNVLKSGMVHFVSTDAHGSEKRRPRMSNAYQWVKSKVSKDEAEKLFKSNPMKVINNKKVIGSPILPNHRRSKSYVNSIASILAVCVIFALIFVNNVLDKEENSLSNVSDDTLGYALVEQAREDEEILNVQVEDKTYNQVVDEYHEILVYLQNDYIETIEEIVGDIKIAKTTIDDHIKRDEVIDMYLNELMELEELSDIKVYALLYDMQNALEQYEYEVEIVEEFRVTYHEIKADKKNYYLDQIDM